MGNRAPQPGLECPAVPARPSRRAVRPVPLVLPRVLRFPAAGVLAALAALAAPAVAAQSGRLQIPPPGPKPGPAEQPAPPPAQEPAPAVAAAPSLWEPPANAAEQIFHDFEKSRSQAASARVAALERLRALGLETRATALKALASDWGPTVLLAAELMEWVGMTAGEDPSDVAALIEAASRTGMVEAAGRCLDAALRLNGGALPARAVSLLAHPNRNVRVVAEGRLQRAPERAHVERLLQHLQHGRDADVRLRAARLLAGFPGEPEVRLALRAALRDESAEVCFSAAVTLAGEARPEQVAFVVSELRQRAIGAEAGYLAFALLLQQQEHDATLIPEDVLPRLELLLDDSDLFASGASAACLAEYAYRTGSGSTPPSWRSTVPFALVRSIGGVVFYPQFSRFSPLAEDALERISGEEFVERREWIGWLERVGSGGVDFFCGRVDLGDADLPRLRLAWSRGAERSDRRALSGADAWLLPSERLAGARVLAELRAGLERSGVLGSVAAANRFGAAEDPVRAVLEIAVGGQRKRLVFRGAAAASVEDLLGRCDRAWEAAAWQTLASSDAAGREFVVARLDAMEGADPSARARAMAELTRGRAAGLDDAVLRAWCARLTSDPAVAEAWDAGLAAELLAELPARARDADCALALTEAALLRPDAALASPLADAAAMIDEPLRGRVLARAFERLGLEAARAVAADDRLAVRVSALAALPVLGAGAAPALRAELASPELPARVAAVRGLGELAAAEALDEVAPLADPGQPHELRKEAVWALGRFGAPRALPRLQEAAASEQPALRVTALLAIAAIPGEEAEVALGALFPEYAGAALESSYLRALLERGAAGARRTLQPYLVHEDPVFARRAALLGGLLGDPAVAKDLMDWLPGDPRNAELLEALASTLCVDFRTLPDPAGTYLAWWRDHADQPASSWFAAAARASGFELPPGFAEGGPRARESVATLLAVLEGGPKHLRASATYFLHVLTGVDGRIVLSATPSAEIARRAAPWRAWLDG